MVKKFLFLLLAVLLFTPPVFARIDGFSIGGGFQFDEYILYEDKDTINTFNFGFNIDADLFFTRKFSVAMNSTLAPASNPRINGEKINDNIYGVNIKDNLFGILLSHRIGVRYFFLDTRVFDLGIGGGFNTNLLFYDFQLPQDISYSYLDGGIGIYLELPMRFYPAKRFWIGLTHLIAYNPYRTSLVYMSTLQEPVSHNSHSFLENYHGLQIEFRIAFGFRLQ